MSVGCAKQGWVTSRPRHRAIAIMGRMLSFDQAILIVAFWCTARDITGLGECSCLHQLWPQGSIHACIMLIGLSAGFHALKLFKSSAVAYYTRLSTAHTGDAQLHQACVCTWLACKLARPCMAMLMHDAFLSILEHACTNLIILKPRSAYTAPAQPTIMGIVPMSYLR